MEPVFDVHPVCTECFVTKLQEPASQTEFYDDFVVSTFIVLIQRRFVPRGVFFF